MTKVTAYPVTAASFVFLRVKVEDTIRWREEKGDEIVSVSHSAPTASGAALWTAFVVARQT